MNLLALETATTVCSVALLQDGEVIVDLTLDRPRSHAENLVPMIDDALRYGRIQASDVDAVAVSSGPGSYTGLRIGVSTAKGFAAAIDADLISVPSLKALAFGLIGVEPSDRIAAALDARRDEAYVSAYRVGADGDLQSDRETAAVRRTEIESWLGDKGEPVWLVGEGWAKMTDALRSLRYRYVREVKPAARNVALLGYQTLESGHVEDLVTFEPYYLKEFVAGKPAATPFEKLSF